VEPGEVRVEGRVFAGYTRALEGAEVVFTGQGAGYSTRSAADGSFALSLPPGTYDVVARADGYAESALYRVDPGTSGALTLRLYPVFYRGWPVAAPRIGLEVDGYRYRMRIETEAPFRVAFLSVDQEPGFPFAAERQLTFTELPDAGWRSLEGMLDGVTEGAVLHLLVYDQNNNRAMVSVPLAGLDEVRPPPVELGAVEDLRATAVTLPREVYLLEGPAAAFQVVQVRWSAYRWPAAALGRPHGFRVWRELDGEEVFVGSYGPDTLAAYDRTLEGVWDRPVSYRVVPYLADVEGPSASVDVVPLPPFEVSNLRPRDGERVGPEPEFSWEASRTVSEHQFYYPLLWNTVTGQEVRSIVPGGFTEATHLDFDETSLEPLWPGRAYGFEVNMAFAVDDTARPSAYSVAIDRYGQLLGVPVPGEFNVFEVVP